MNKTYDIEGTIDLTFGISSSFCGSNGFLDIESRSSNSKELTNSEIIYVLQQAILQLEKTKSIRDETT